MKLLSQLLALLFSFSFVSSAVAANEDVSVISLFGRACETVKADEAKSSVRVRATDKASFKSVENIPELSSYRNKMSAHDFNVLVYGIVDNYIEDLSVKTTKQDDNEICVEMTGFLHSENILKAIDENYQKFANKQAYPPSQEAVDYPQTLEIEDETALIPTVTAFPPAPTLPKMTSAEEIYEQKSIVSQPKEDAVTGASKVFIEKTKFFNGMTTNAYFEDIQDIILQKQGIAVITDKNSADYILKPEVLKAKVDAINAQTNRLQMIISLELYDTRKETNITERQNRFILFESKEDEQSVASSLMKKLFTQAGNIIIKNISTKTPGALMNRDAIITPVSAEKSRYPN